MAVYLCVDVRDFLDGAPFARTAMSGGYDTSISALAEFLDELVLGIDDKIRVQCSEAMSLHCGETERVVRDRGNRSSVRSRTVRIRQTHANMPHHTKP